MSSHERLKIFKLNNENNNMRRKCRSAKRSYGEYAFGQSVFSKSFGYVHLSVKQKEHEVHV